MADALSRGQFDTPLVVGDRLDTDIAGANAAGLPSLMVLTGVSTAREAVHAIPAERPTFIAETLAGLHAAADHLSVRAQPAWRINHDDGVVTVHTAGHDDSADGLGIVRATARAVWESGLDRVSIRAATTPRRPRCGAGRCWTRPSTSVGAEMATDPNQIRAQIDELLASLPTTPDDGQTMDQGGELDIDEIARRLEEAHDVLVRALESVEKG